MIDFKNGDSQYKCNLFLMLGNKNLMKNTNAEVLQHIVGLPLTNNDYLLILHVAFSLLKKSTWYILLRKGNSLPPIPL